MNQFWGLSRNVADFFFYKQLQNINIYLFWKLKENSCVGSALIIGKSRVLIFACFQLSRIKKWHDPGSKSWEAEKYFISIDPRPNKHFFYSKKLKIEEKPEKWVKFPVIPDIGPWGTLGGLMRLKTIWVI